MPRSQAPIPGDHEPDPFADLIADVEPLDPTGLKSVQVGTALWAVAFVALLPFWGKLADSGRLWWVWVCSAGLALGLFGIEYCRRRAANGPAA